MPLWHGHTGGLIHAASLPTCSVEEDLSQTTKEYCLGKVSTQIVTNEHLIFLIMLVFAKPLSSLSIVIERQGACLVYAYAVTYMLQTRASENFCLYGDPFFEAALCTLDFLCNRHPPPYMSIWVSTDLKKTVHALPQNSN